MLVADVKLKWTRSISDDITSRKVNVTINGSTTVYDVGPEVAEYSVEVKALGSVSFYTTVFDGDGKQISAEAVSFMLGNLEDPLPDTGLGWEVTAIREVPDA